MNLKVSKVSALMRDDVHRAHNLRHLFKDEKGVSPAEYVELLRLRKAAELPATTFLSVKEVMCETGMTNQSHFVRVFKRAYGLTPTCYRASRYGAAPGRRLVIRSADVL